MSDSTAATTASIRFLTADYFGAPTHITNVLERYVRLYLRRPAHRHSLTENWFEGKLQAPNLSKPEWLPRVQQRIERSAVVRPPGSGIDERWLSDDIASAGWSFFDLTADLLPSEPFIYSSRAGELVAEFEAPRGSLTIILSSDSSLIYASTKGESVSEVFGLSAIDRIRDHLQKLKSFVGGKSDGRVEARPADRA